MARTQARLPMFVWFRLTRWTAPLYPKSSRFRNARNPAELGSGEIPTIAIDRGRIKREMSIAGAAVTAFRGLQPECFFRRIVPSPGR
jgi:hypothetical protein